MQSVLKSRVSAVVAGSLVVVGLGAGGAVAANTIGSSDIRNGSVRAVDLAKGSVDRSEIRNGSINGPQLGTDVIGRRQVRPESIGVNQIAPFVREQIEEDGSAKGEPGSDGKDGVSGYEVVGRGTDAGTVAPRETVTIESLCMSENQEVNDKVATAGGAQVIGDGILKASYPSSIEQVGEPSEEDPAGLWAAKGWTVVVTAGNQPASVQPYVICQDNAEDDD